MSWIIVFIIFVWAFAHFYLRGEDLSAYDLPKGEPFSTADSLNAEHQAIIDSMVLSDQLKGVPFKQRLPLMREYFDAMFEGRQSDCSITPCHIYNMAAEWVVAPNADSRRRVLYLHGGAFMMGNPKSHRVITSKFSDIANAAVLAIDYRLMPENKRIDSVEDCRTAYRWILHNGPNGVESVDTLIVAGDSAGGNLTLATIAWARDVGIRQADAAVALSPATDSTLGSPSFRGNIATDAILGPVFKPMLRLPRTLLLWLSWITNRINPRSPILSPALGDLSGLPPILVHASEVEMLRDDARRYVNKAAAAGSPVFLQTWDHVVHVWHMFDPDLSEARAAFEQIRLFLQQHVAQELD